MVWIDRLCAASAQAVDVAIEQVFGQEIGLPGFFDVVPPPGLLCAGPVEYACVGSF